MTKMTSNDASKQAACNQQSLLVYPPAIPFKKDKMDKMEKESYKTIEIDLDPSDEQNKAKTEWKVPTFEDGTTEDWVKWVIHFEELEAAYPLNTPGKKILMARTLLCGEARDIFDTGVSQAKPSGSTRATVVSDEQKWTAGIKAVQSKYFNNDQNAWKRQCNYMRYHLFFKDDNFKAFRARLLELNKYLKYFPIPTGRSTVEVLKDDELVEILDSAKPLEYQQELLVANYDPYAKSFAELSCYLLNLEQQAAIAKALDKQKGNTSSASAKSNKGGKSNKKNNKRKTSKEDVTCSYCGKDGHLAKDCWEDPKNAEKRPKGYKQHKNKAASNVMKTMTTDEFNFLCQGVAQSIAKRAPKKKKRRITIQEDDEDGQEANVIAQMATQFCDNKLTDTSDEDTDYCFSLARKKKQKTSHMCTEVVGQIVDQHGEIVPLRILLDIGTTSTILLRKFA